MTHRDLIEAFGNGRPDYFLLIQDVTNEAVDS